MPTGLSRPLAAVVRRLAPPPAGSDAELLDRYRLLRDEAAFAALVRRHAPAVRAVARARLANRADADDVTQATFLVLARDAGRVRASVAGFLVRVAHLTALQHRRNLARRRTDPLPDELAAGADPAAVAAEREVVAVVAEELAGLPDKLRAVVALCALDGLTAAVAADRLGVPKGTVDSRLATAKRRLAARLTRRGLAAGAVAGLVAVPATAEFADALTRAACGYATAGGITVPTPVSLLADGVHSAMSSSARLLALGMVAAALTGTAGTALYQSGPGDDKPQAKTPPAAKPVDPLKPTDTPALTQVVEPVANEAEARTRLLTPAQDLPPELSLLELCEWVFVRHGLVARVDVAAFRRLPTDEPAMGAVPTDRRDGTAFVSAAVAADGLTAMIQRLYETKLSFPVRRGLSVADVLADAVAQLPGRCAYRLRGNQVLFVPAFQPPAIPGGGQAADFYPLIEPARMMEQLVGPPVSVAIVSQTLTEAVVRLRALTGANIVIDARATEEVMERVAGTFDDVRLLTVLQVLADQAGLKPVTLNNVYYLTDLDLHGSTRVPLKK